MALGRGIAVAAAVVMILCLVTCPPSEGRDHADGSRSYAIRGLAPGRWAVRVALDSRDDGESYLEGEADVVAGGVAEIVLGSGR